MGLGHKIIQAIERRQEVIRQRQPGALGRFYTNGGNSLLYDAPVHTNELILDVGGYRGDWTAEMIARYGCRSRIYEPVPDFSSACKLRYSRNALVTVIEAGLSNTSGSMNISLNGDGSSQFIDMKNTAVVSSLDVRDELSKIDGDISCLKLNIEGGEYDVLDRLIETKDILRVRSIFVQFHNSPDNWRARYEQIQNRLRETHDPVWQYDLVWEKWLKR